MADKWYVRNTSGKVFGPIDLVTLKKWVCDGRVEPLAGISPDLKNWMLAPLMPELEMNWIVENNPGQFYGPTNRAVVDDLVKSGTLNAGARFYLDDRGAGAAALADRADAVKKLETEMAGLSGKLAAKEKDLAAANAALAAREKDFAAVNDAVKAKEKEVARAADALAAKEKELARKEEALRAAEAERDAARGSLKEAERALKDKDRENAALEKKIGKMSEVHERRWTGKVIEPEVVVSDEPPPPIARAAFGGASLADIERQAQAELAKMGSGGLRGFFKAKR